MYIVLNKITGEEIHRNPAPKSQELTGKEVYFNFDKDIHCIVESVPEFYKMVGGVPVELDISEKVNKGIIELNKFQKILNNEIVNKEPFEYMTLSEFKEFKILELSAKCKIEASKIFPIEKQINVLVGACDNYPAYLQGEVGKENIKRFIELYKGIYSVNESLINSYTTNEEIENIKISFPTENDILQALNV
jgi:hypothetical protein